MMETCVSVFQKFGCFMYDESSLGLHCTSTHSVITTHHPPKRRHWRTKRLIWNNNYGVLLLHILSLDLWYIMEKTITGIIVLLLYLVFEGFSTISMNTTNNNPCEIGLHSPSRVHCCFSFEQQFLLLLTIKKKEECF